MPSNKVVPPSKLPAQPGDGADEAFEAWVQHYRPLLIDLSLSGMVTIGDLEYWMFQAWQASRSREASPDAEQAWERHKAHAADDSLIEPKFAYIAGYKAASRSRELGIRPILQKLRDFVEYGALYGEDVTNAIIEADRILALLPTPPKEGG